jgi:manganese-dependent inorganic pyrophosphatase
VRQNHAIPEPREAPIVYVTGHRNPDTDAIAAAVGYAELKQRLDPGQRYLPVRLGECNAQTRWVLERSGAPEPDLLPHIMLRVQDMMRHEFATARHDEPIRTVGLTMAREDIDLLPILDDDGALSGVVSERELARRYVRESRGASRLDCPTTVRAIAGVLDGEVLTGEEVEVASTVWVLAMDLGSLPVHFGEGDVVVVGDRPEVQRVALEVGVALLVLSNSATPSDEILALARERGAAIIVSPLDSYVTARLITLSAPCRALADREPLTVRPDDLMSDVAEQVKDIHYRAAVAVDGEGRPVGLVTRGDLLSPRPRRVLLVDHAEQVQSVPGVEEAEIVEILDHHNVGSIETHVPVRATFDPVGSTATLVIERFRQAGMEPARPTATLLLGAILSDTVILNSPTTTERDEAAVSYLERVLALDAVKFGREMFERTSDLSDVSAEAIVSADAKVYEQGEGTISIAQVETVGPGLLERKDELLDALEAARERGGYQLFALMVTDILAKGTELLVSGDVAAIERAFNKKADDRRISLPGVMSRKKQVAPRLLAGSPV